MGVIINSIDHAITGYENFDLTVEELAVLVQDHYITGKSRKQLQKLKSWVKGGVFRIFTRHPSEDGRWLLCVSNQFGIFDVLLGTKIVWLQDRERERMYRVPDRKGREFRNTVHFLIQQELLNQAKYF